MTTVNKPYTYKVGKGQVTFVFMSEEEAENYKKIMEAFDKKDKGLDGQHFALGMFKDEKTKKYNLVKIVYNPLTNEAFVDSIEETSTLLSHAGNEFKRAAVRLKIV